MSHHILVPLDGSSLAECVLPHVVTLYEALDGEVTLLRAVTGECPPSPEKPIDPLDYRMRASEADSPTRASSGSQKVHQGMFLVRALTGR